MASQIIFYLIYITNWQELIKINARLRNEDNTSDVAF